MAFHSDGFSYNVVAGPLFADCIVSGHTNIDIRAFSTNRFDDEGAHLARSLYKRDLGEPLALTRSGIFG